MPKISWGDVAAIMAGAFVDMGIAWASEQLHPQPLTTSFPVHVSDVVGDAFGAATLIVGYKTSNQKIMLFGAGGLGMSLASMLNRALKQYTPYKASAKTANIAYYTPRPLPPMSNVSPRLASAEYGGYGGGAGKASYNLPTQCKTGCAGLII